MSSLRSPARPPIGLYGATDRLETTFQGRIE
jgi:hypothetical protein